MMMSCVATWPDHSNSASGDYSSGSCSAVMDIVAGDILKVLSLHLVNLECERIYNIYVLFQ